MSTPAYSQLVEEDGVSHDTYDTGEAGKLLVEDDSGTVNGKSGQGKKKGTGYAGAVFNVVNTIIGGGMLALPFAFKTSGLVLGVILVFVFMISSTYTAMLLAKCSAQLKAGRTYSEIAFAAFGPVGPLLFEVAVVVFLFGALVGYIIIIGEILTPYVNRLFELDERVVMLVASALVCFPLINLRRINSLKFTSMIAIVLLAYLLGCIVVLSGIGLEQSLAEEDIRLFRATPEIFGVLPIISFAFTFHPSVFPVWNEMQVRTERSIRITIAFSTMICLVVYLLAGVFGYLSFAEHVSDNILTHYDDADWYLDVGKIGYSFIIMFSYPLLCFPLRVALDRFLNKVFFKIPPSVEPSRRRLTITAIVVYCLSYLVAILPIGIGTVFGLTGATAGNLIVTTFPSLFYIFLKKNPREDIESRLPWWVVRAMMWQKIPALFLVVMSTFLTITGIFSVIAFQLLAGFDDALGDNLQHLQ